jgi:WD40 repeat protein
MNPDGTQVLVVGADSTARVRDAKTGVPIGAPMRHPAQIFRAQFSPDGSRVVTVTQEQVRIWDSRTGAPLGPPLMHGAAVNSAVFSADGQRVLTASADGAVRIWDMRTVTAREHADLRDLARQIVGGRMHGPRDFAPDGGEMDRNRVLRKWREDARGWSDAADGSFKQWVHWYFADPTTRPDQPGLWRRAPAP